MDTGPNYVNFYVGFNLFTILFGIYDSCAIWMSRSSRQVRRRNQLLLLSPMTMTIIIIF